MLRLALASLCCVLAADVSAAGASFHEVPADADAPAHLELFNDAFSIRVFPQEGGRVEGATNLCALLPCAPTNAATAWRALRAKTGERTIWLGAPRTNGVSRSIGLTLGGGSSPLTVELILANATDRFAEVSEPVAARLAPFERRLFRGLAADGAPLRFEPAADTSPMSDADGRACAKAVSLGCGALTNGEFKTALQYFERALGYGGSAAALHVRAAYCLRRLGTHAPSLRVKSSKRLRMAARSEPLDVWNLVERAFLEDDGEGAAECAARFGGDPGAVLAEVIEEYRRIGAAHEAELLRRQAGDPPAAK